MTLVEMFILALAVAALYYFLTPLQKRLEFILYKFFRSKKRGGGTVVDITDYSKNKDKPK